MFCKRYNLKCSGGDVFKRAIGWFSFAESPQAVQATRQAPYKGTVFFKPKFCRSGETEGKTTLSSRRRGCPSLCMSTVYFTRDLRYINEAQQHSGTELGPSSVLCAGPCEDAVRLQRRDLFAHSSIHRSLMRCDESRFMH